MCESLGRWTGTVRWADVATVTWETAADCDWHRCELQTGRHTPRGHLLTRWEQRQHSRAIDTALLTRVRVCVQATAVHVHVTASMDKLLDLVLVHNHDRRGDGDVVVQTVPPYRPFTVQGLDLVVHTRWHRVRLWQ